METNSANSSPTAGLQAPARSPLARHVRSLPHRVLAYLRGLLNPQGNYYIAPGYRCRREGTYFDDMENTDNWQREVYEYAAEVMEKFCLNSVYDVGCGSGYKLVKFLGKYNTIGFDLEPTINSLMQKYPDRQWNISNFQDRNIERADLVICADVIEHVPDPELLLDFLDRIAKDKIIISTPERNFLYRPGSRYRYGPPTNPSHLREWTADELYRYVSRKFTVIHHQITNAKQATQMIVCSRKALK